MKYLLIIGIALLVLWLWKNSRRAERSAENKTSAKPQARSKAIATEIVACDVCHVHLPRSEALAGPGGTFCSEAHRKQAGL